MSRFFSTFGWLKIAMISFFSFGGLSTLLVFYPSYSENGMWVGLILTILAVIVSVRTSYTKDWWGQMAFIHLWALLMLGIAVRAFTDVVPVFWVWLGILVLSYCFAWALPFLSPALSSALLREQLAPKTKLGKGCMSVLLAIAPVIATVSASIGMYGVRFGKGKWVSLVGGILGTIVSLGLSQAMAHQMWPHRPWAKQDASEEG